MNDITQDLQCYRVGGSVRDELMGLPAGDHDWVVVGATPEDMLARGFKPVGKDFPVFLHPHTREEYALARTERKTGPGYRGFSVHFSPEVTLEEDLQRRDLTINAMAMPHTGHIIDPFNGRQDLHDRVFRHVSPAFREDPVRILRLARFAARFPDFIVADETRQLMREMCAAGEVNALVPERVWQELSRGLMSKRPSRMLEVLEAGHALAILLPEMPPVPHLPDWLNALDASAAAGDPLPVRFAILLAAVHDMPQTHPRPRNAAPVADVASIARRLRAPNDCTDAATRLAAEMPGGVPVAAMRWFQARQHASDQDWLALFDRHDAWRRPERLAHLLLAARRLADPAFDGQRPLAEAMQQALQAARRIDTGALARQHPGNPQAIRAAINEARLQGLHTGRTQASASRSMAPTAAP